MNETMKTKNPAAVALGKLAAGKPKNFSPEERALRRERIKIARTAKNNRANLLARLLRESHEAQFNGVDFQQATFPMWQAHNLTEDELKHLQSAPDPSCE